MNQLNWIAIYNDGSVLWQYEPGYRKGDKTKVHSSDEIDRDKVVCFAVYRNRYQKKILELHLEPSWQKLIYVDRVLRSSGPNAPQHDTVVHLVGWKANIAGKDVQSINYIFGDDTVTVRGAWGTPVHPAIKKLGDEQAKRFLQIRGAFGGALQSEVKQ